MRIREYSIRRYGPLRDTGRVMLSGFNLIYGNNEDGKTLTIDALVKLLLGKTSKEREFAAIERVDESPEGYVIIDDRDQCEYKLPEKGTLSDITGLTANDCSNIFIIRNSDLSISNEGTFYTGVTERLTGLRTRYIDSVIESLRTIGKITPRGIFRDVGEERLKSRIDAASALIETIGVLISECKSQELDRVEERIVEITIRMKSITHDIDSLNDARLRDRYEKGSKALNELNEARQAAGSIDGVNENDLERWRDNERDIEMFSADREKLLHTLEHNRLELQTVADKLKDEETLWSESEEKKRRLDETIRPLIKQHEERLVSIPRYEIRKKFFGIAGLLSGILFGISLTGLLLLPGMFFYIIAGLLFVMLLLSGSFYYISLRSLSDISVDFQRLNTEAARYSLDAESLPRIIERIEIFNGEQRRVSERLQEYRRQMQNLKERVEELSGNTIPELDAEIRRRQEEIYTIRNVSGEDSIENYRNKLRQKDTFKNRMQTQAALLNSGFGKGNDTADGNITYWQEKIRELRQYKDKSPGIEYDESALVRLKEERKKLEQELELLDQKRSGITDQMKEVERKANRILQSGDEYVFCKSMNDLAAIQTMLTGYIERHESTRENVIAAAGIFTSIQEEEQEKIGALFGEDRPVSKYYREITGGRYTEVVYDVTNGCIEVIQENGSRLPASKLSGGAYDQLYFAVRIALGEELLKGDTGFFVLDDPFIKSDIDRLHQQIKMLHRIAARGWQVLFFSAKAEILESLKSDIKEEMVKLIDYRKIIQQPLTDSV